MASRMSSGFPCLLIPCSRNIFPLVICSAMLLSFIFSLHSAAHRCVTTFCTGLRWRIKIILLLLRDMSRFRHCSSHGITLRHSCLTSGSHTEGMHLSSGLSSDRNTLSLLSVFALINFKIGSARFQVANPSGIGSCYLL